MPAPNVSGLTVTIPANSKFVIGAGLSRAVINITTSEITLDACAGGSETKSINWKQGVAGSVFVNCPPLSWVGRTAISGASATVNGSAVSAGNVKTHVRGMVFTDLSVANPLQTASVTYSYKRERYDLLEVDEAGVVHVVKGTECDFAASEFLPAATTGRHPLFYAYVWNDTVELIDAHSWSSATPRNPLQAARLSALRTRNWALIPNLRAALTAGSATLAGYGDSITAVGGGWAATGGSDDTTWLDNVANNQTGFVTRDASGFVYWHDAEMRTKYSQLGASWPQSGGSQVVNWGWGKVITNRLASTYSATVNWRNWGIGGTNSDSTTGSGGLPNGGETTRLTNFLADSFNAVIVNFQMNDFVGFATSDLTTPLTNVVSSIKAAKPTSDIILMGAPGINSENPNPLAWLERADEIYRRVAVAQNVAYVPTYMITHNDPGYLQISRQHYSGGNRYNHQTPYELSKYADWIMAALGF